MKDTPKNRIFLFKYFHDGSWWTLEIPAATQDDAQARIKKIPLAQPLGELTMKVPASAGFLARLYCWLRNAFSQKRISTD